MIRAAYEIHKQTSEAIFLIDKSDEQVTISITNDAENVVYYINMLYPGKRIFYKDTMNIWSELLHTEGHFEGYAPIKEK